MKSGYYIIPRYCTEHDKTLLAQNVGIQNKIDMQVNELSKEFSMRVINIYRTRNKTLFDKIFSRLQFVSEPRDYNSAEEMIESPFFIYIRNCPPLDKEYIRFLKKIRNKYKECKIIVEIPTYPYDVELFPLIKHKPLLRKDKKFRGEYYKYIDRITVFSKNDTVFGIKTINLMNGINVNDTEPICPKKEFNKNEINIIFVGTMRQHHGLERIIKGLSQYNGSASNKTLVKLHLVGEGPEQKYYKDLTDQYGLQSFVFFYGKKEGSELSELYNIADIAINSFGMYKLGLDWLSSIKSREYIAKGLPTVNGCKTDVFENFPCDYCINFPNDESIIDIDKVVKWYIKLIEKYSTPSELAHSIRKYALNHVDNSVVLRPLIDYILQQK